MTDMTALALNRECYCWPVDRDDIIAKIIEQDAAENMAAMLSERPHYFANTSIFLSSTILSAITDQIRAIEDVIKLQGYRDTVEKRTDVPQGASEQLPTKGVFMGYDFHITKNGPRLIEINSNAGGAFIVNMIEQAGRNSSEEFSSRVAAMFENEGVAAARTTAIKSIAIVDTKPDTQFHYPDMCLAKSLLEKKGFTVVITDPSELSLETGRLRYGETPIDVVYNRLTDFNLTEPENAVVWRAYLENAAVVTPTPHHHALYADKRNLILLSDAERLASFGASPLQIEKLRTIPATSEVTHENADELWAKRKQLFFKPQAGYGSRGAFRGAKLTKKTWAEIIKGGYIAQERVLPPLRAVTVNGEQIELKFDVRVYTYDGDPLLLAARIYQGQTTNLRTEGGGLAAVISVQSPAGCEMIGC